MTLKRKWFNKIAFGVKTTEYREIKPYWIKRLCNPTPIKYDFVFFRNGYNPKSETMKVEFKGLIIEPFDGEKPSELHFGILLGKVLEINGVAVELPLPSAMQG
jgi:hypothetical protein